MERLTAGEIILVRFPFSDLTSRKYRPALVVAVAEFSDIIVCQITSSKYGKRNIVQITKGDFLSGGLPVKSYIRPDKLFTLSNKLVVGNLGKLRSAKTKEVKKELARILELA